MLADNFMTAKRIVLIEDDREISTTLQAVLNNSGYDVTACCNGIEGRKAIEEDSPDLVITDMMMPKMGGFPVLEFLKTMENPPKVIMVTANEGGRHKAYAEMLGVAAYLRKPFAMDLFLDTIEKVLAGEMDEPDSSPPKRKRSKKSS